MPRKARPGGTRAGTPGTRYPNRTDLVPTRSVPQRVATGQTYGKAQQQQQAMRTVPMAPPPTLIPPGTRPAPGTYGPSPAPAPAAPPSSAGGGLASLLQLSGGPNPQSAQGQPSAHPLLPGSPLPPLERPTERPNEPVTAGAATGAGPGPGALPTGPVSAGGTSLSTLLQSVAQSTNSPAVAALANRASSAGI